MCDMWTHCFMLHASVYRKKSKNTIYQVDTHKLNILDLGKFQEVVTLLCDTWSSLGALLYHVKTK